MGFFKKALNPLSALKRAKKATKIGLNISKKATKLGVKATKKTMGMDAPRRSGGLKPASNPTTRRIKRKMGTESYD